MTRPPLTGPHLEILERLRNGQPRDHIAKVGHYRGAWTRAEVDRVAKWLVRDVEAGRWPQHDAVPIPHGTEYGYRRCRNQRGGPCDTCKTARNAADQTRANRKRSA